MGWVEAALGAEALLAYYSHIVEAVLVSGAEALLAYYSHMVEAFLQAAPLEGQDLRFRQDFLVSLEAQALGPLGGLSECHLWEQGHFWEHDHFWELRHLWE